MNCTDASFALLSCGAAQVSGFTCPGKWLIGQFSLSRKSISFNSRLVFSPLEKSKRKIFAFRSPNSSFDLGYNTFFNSAVQWGAIGPARLYSKGQIYWPLLFGFLAGALSPIPVYFLSRKYPNSFWKYVSMPAFWYGGINWCMSVPYQFVLKIFLTHDITSIGPYNLSYIIPTSKSPQFDCSQIVRYWYRSLVA